MHLRRALLLFAIVLGLAALVAGLSGSADRSEPGPEPVTTEPATTQAGAGGEPAELRFRVSRPRKRSLAAGAAARVVVVVDLPGLVEIPELGLSASADAVTPARFDVLEEEPGRYPILFSPAGADDLTDAEPVGTLVIAPAEPEA